MRWSTLLGALGVMLGATAVCADPSVRRTPIVVGSVKGVTALAFDPVKPRLAAVLSSGSLVVWEADTTGAADTWKEVWRVQPDPARAFRLRRIVSGPASTFLVAGDDGNVYAADADTRVLRRLEVAASGRRASRLHKKAVTALAISSDGRQVASGDELGVVMLTSLQSGVPARRVGRGEGTGEIVGLAFDGPSSLTVLDEDMDIFTWDVSTEQIPRPLSRLSVDDRGTTVATGAAGYDARGQFLAVPAEHRVYVGPRGDPKVPPSQASTTSGGALVPTGSELSRDRSIVPYFTAVGERRGAIPTNSGEVTRLALSPGACFAAGTSNERDATGRVNRLRVWQMIAPKLTADHTIYQETLDGAPDALAIDASGRRLAVALDDGRVGIWTLVGTSFDDCRAIRLESGVDTGKLPPVLQVRDPTVPPLLTMGQPSVVAVAPFQVLNGVHADVGTSLAVSLRADISRRLHMSTAPPGADLDAIYKLLADECNVGICDQVAKMKIENLLQGKIVIAGSVSRVADGLTIVLSRYGPLPTIGDGGSKDNVRDWKCDRCSEADQHVIVTELGWLIGRKDPAPR